MFPRRDGQPGRSRGSPSCARRRVTIAGGALGVTTDSNLVAKFAAGGSQFTVVAPTRLLDTRTGVKPAAGSITTFQVTAFVGIPANATAVVLNTTATEANAIGFVTVYPTGQPLTVVSSLDADIAGQTTPNLVSARRGTGGKITLYGYAGGHLLVDVAGWFTL